MDSSKTRSILARSGLFLEERDVMGRRCDDGRKAELGTRSAQHKKVRKDVILIVGIEGEVY